MEVWKAFLVLAIVSGLVYWMLRDQVAASAPADGSMVKESSLAATDAVDLEAENAALKFENEVLRLRLDLEEDLHRIDLDIAQIREDLARIETRWQEHMLLLPQPPRFEDSTRPVPTPYCPEDHDNIIVISDLELGRVPCPMCPSAEPRESFDSTNPLDIQDNLKPVIVDPIKLPDYLPPLRNPFSDP